MNYLAHLFLARQTPDSHLGNLLGDFRRGAQLTDFHRDVLTGLNNHYLVDRFTDSHTEVKAAKPYFHPSRRRFAGVALDVLFDHFLIKHWPRFTDQNLARFREQSYALLEARLDTMPPRMQQVIMRMVSNDGLIGYADLDGVGRALHYLAMRIRFDNTFEKSIVDIELHYDKLEQLFLGFFPELLHHVDAQDLEHGPTVFAVPGEDRNGVNQ